MRKNQQGMPQASTLGSLGRSAPSVDGRSRSLCGRCGRVVSARPADGPRFCRDCQSTDPVFCGRAQR